jgi:hypothetical protein
MITTLPDATRTKLAKLLGMLGSDHVGERDNAARAVHKLMTEAKATWNDILSPNPPEHREPLISTWRQTCSKLQKRQGDLRPWERGFVADLPRFPKISPKQRRILAEIADRVLGAQR